ncbi:MAG: hypothetical protein KAT68_19615 [Bacteroidales bacterium]|nr:hypothetical protein [Bacteroidales bacterium]
MNKQYLLQKYYPGIAKISQELYDECKERSGGKCEVKGCNDETDSLHHLVGRRRVAWSGNLIFLCQLHHQGAQGIHGYGKGTELRLKLLKKLQNKYFDMGFTEEEVRYLLGSKSGKLY